MRSLSSGAPLTGSQKGDGRWEVWLREPLGLPMQGAISVQLPPGRYPLYRRSSAQFELIPWHVPIVLEFSELEQLRQLGSLVIEGRWP